MSDVSQIFKTVLDEIDINNMAGVRDKGSSYGLYIGLCNYVFGTAYNTAVFTVDDNKVGLVALTDNDRITCYFKPGYEHLLKEYVFGKIKTFWELSDDCGVVIV